MSEPTAPKKSPVKALSWRALLAALLVTCVVGGLLYYGLDAYMLSQAEKNIQGVLLEHKGVHHYVQRNTHPALYQLKDDGEVPLDFYSPELLSSSFMLRNIHTYYNEERAKLGLPSIYYKMAAKNPRNPVNKADELETRLIDMFNRDRTLDHYNEVIEISGQKHLYYAVPFLTNNEACLKCHGPRQDAPRQLRERYPGQGGFNERVGEIRAIESVRAPLQSDFESFQLIFAALLAGVVALMLLMLFNHRLGAVVRDRTKNLEWELGERHRAESALRESEERHRLLVESANEGIVVAQDGMVKFFNSRMLELTGMTAQEYLGSPFIEHVHPDDRERVMERHLRRLQGDPTPNTDPFRIVDRKGEVKWLLPNGVLIQWEGRPATLAFFTDISEKRRAEEKVAQAQEKIRNVLQSTPMGIHAYQLTPQGQLIFSYANPAADALLGVDHKQFLGKTIEEAFPGLVGTQIPELYRRVARDGQSVSDLHLDYQEGQIAGALEVLAFQDMPHSVTVMFTDVTERKKAEENRLRLEAQLRQAQKMEAIGTLAGGIAHDFNNILAAIMGFAEMAHDDARAGKADPADLRQILTSAERASQLVRQILAFSRKDEPDLKVLDLNKVVSTSLAILQRTLPKMIAIETRLAGGLPPIKADPTQMEQVLLNLAANAADAMPQGGRLTMETQLVELDQEYCGRHLEVRPGLYVMLAISDTGQGMDETTSEHIFEPFFTTKEVGKGTGLGLSTAYGIVKSHEGHIYCYSELGLGTTFKIYLPAFQLKESLPESGEAEATSLEALRGGETLLLVDDEEGLRRLASQSLTDMGYRVVTAASGEEALEIYAQESLRPDLVIMDLGMPGMGGHEAMKAILALDPQAKVVIASGYLPLGRPKAALEDGALGFVPKPFRRKELLSTVRKILDGA